MTFSNPLYLTFLVSVPFFIIMHFLILKHTKRRAVKFANFEALARVTGMEVLNKNITLLIIRLWALIFLILSAAGAVVWYSGNISEYDFVLAIDTSSSMLADDFRPDRLEAAKAAVLNFLEDLPSQARVGLVTFSGTAYANQFPTTDLNLLKDAVQEIEVSRVGGTDLGDAIITSSNLLVASERPRAVILLTDGQANVGVPVGEAVSYANQYQVAVHTVGIGTEEGGTFIRTGLVSRIDEQSLRDIADGTGGRFFRAENQQQIEEAYLAIATTKHQLTSIELRLPLLLIALLLLFLEWGLINTKFRTLP